MINDKMQGNREDRDSRLQSLLDMESYDEARLWLMDRVNRRVSDPEWIRLLGMLEVMTGYPRLALARWKLLTEEQLRLPEEKLQSVRDLTEVYDRLYERYNQNLSFIQEEKWEEALTGWETLMKQGEKYPLPLSFYLGHYSLLALNGKEAELRERLAGAPTYVRFSEAVQAVSARILDAAAESFEEIKVKEPTAPSTNGWKVAAISMVGLLAAGVIGGLFVYQSASRTSGTPAATALLQSVQAQASPPAAAADNTERKKQEERIRQLEADKVNLEDRLRKDADTAGQMESLQKLLQASGLNEAVLRNKAALAYYRDGMASFKRKEYDRAAEELGESVRLHSVEYYADDAMFFLIEALKKTRKPAEAVVYEDMFLSEASDSFLYSPYMDDVMLDRAEACIQEGKTQEAKQLLEQIRAEYPAEWTAQEANLLLQQLKS